MQCKEVIKVSELSKRVKEQEYAEKVRMAYEMIEQQEIRSVEEEWKVFRDSDEVRKRGVWLWTGWARDKKGSEWWNDKVRLAVLQKRKVYEKGLQQETEQVFEEYREERWKVKAVVREAEDRLRQS